MPPYFPPFFSLGNVSGIKNEVKKDDKFSEKTFGQLRKKGFFESDVGTVSVEFLAFSVFFEGQFFSTVNVHFEIVVFSTIL